MYTYNTYNKKKKYTNIQANAAFRWSPFSSADMLAINQGKMITITVCVLHQKTVYKPLKTVWNIVCYSLLQEKLC